VVEIARGCAAVVEIARGQDLDVAQANAGPVTARAVGPVTAQANV
jgi:hypothetical protein